MNQLMHPRELNNRKQIILSMVHGGWEDRWERREKVLAFSD